MNQGKKVPKINSDVLSGIVNKSKSPGGGAAVFLYDGGLPLTPEITHPVLEWIFQILYPVFGVPDLRNLGKVSRQIQNGSPDLPLIYQWM